jgi:hypothetical protein
MQTLCPKNWTAFQHYKHRRPPWIRLYRVLLDDFAFQSLPIASRAIAPALWLIASEYDAGRIPFDMPMLAFKLRLSQQDVANALNPLIDNGFFIIEDVVLAPQLRDASGALAARKQNVTTETETETETEKDLRATVPAAHVAAPVAKPKAKRKARRKGEPLPPDQAEGFAMFWSVYPRKHDKAKAVEAWAKIAPDEALTAAIIAAVQIAAASHDWRKEAGRFVPYPTTWLNGRRWEDEAAAPMPPGPGNNWNCPPGIYPLELPADDPRRIAYGMRGI